MISPEYENYGDVNPIEWGGIWVKQIGETEYEIIKNNNDDDKENNIFVFDLQVDISDSWIEKAAVMEFIGMTTGNFNPIQYAIGCIDYYNYLNFGSMYEMGETELREFLKIRNITF